MIRIIQTGNIKILYFEFNFFLIFEDKVDEILRQ